MAAGQARLAAQPFRPADDARLQRHAAGPAGWDGPQSYILGDAAEQLFELRVVAARQYRDRGGVDVPARTARRAPAVSAQFRRRLPRPLAQLRCPGVRRDAVRAPAALRLRATSGQRRRALRAEAVAGARPRRAMVRVL